MKGALLSAVLLLFAMDNVVYGILKINEFMINPLRGNATNWIEVFNPTNQTVSTVNWTLGVDRPNLGTVQTVILSSTVLSIGPYGTIVAGNNNDTTTNGGIVVDVYFNFTAFAANGSSDSQIFLVSKSNGAYYDSILWNTQNPRGFFLNLPFAAGASMSRINASAFGGTLSNWKASTTPIDCAFSAISDKGTPGKINTHVCPTNAPKAMTTAPTKPPTATPTRQPATVAPTRQPATIAPTKTPTLAPTKQPAYETTGVPGQSPMSSGGTRAPFNTFSPIAAVVSPQSSLRPVTAPTTTRGPLSSPMLPMATSPLSSPTSSPMAPPTSCNVRCTTAGGVLGGIRIHRIVRSPRLLGGAKCRERCKVFFPNASLRRGWTCGQCPP